MDELAGVYMYQKKLAQAEQLCLKTLEGRRRVLGEEHTDTQESMINLALVYTYQGKFAQAEPVLRPVTGILSPCARRGTRQHTQRHE